MRKNYKYVLFDLDGTVTDPKIGITKSVQYALKHYQINVEDLDSLTPFIGPPLKESFMQFYGFSEEKATEAVEKYREYFKDIGIFENTVYEGMDKLLSSLVKEGRMVVLATSKPTVFAERILEHFNLSEYFTFISGSELGGNRTKKSEVIEYALTQCNIKNLDEVVMIGDREYDIKGAREVGVDSIGVLFGYGDFDELNNAGATYLARDIQELAEILL